MRNAEAIREPVGKRMARGRLRNVNGLPRQMRAEAERCDSSRIPLLKRGDDVRPDEAERLARISARFVRRFV